MSKNYDPAIYNARIAQEIEGLDTTIVSYWVVERTGRNTSTTISFKDEDDARAAFQSKLKHGRKVEYLPRSKDQIPAYHQSLPDLIRAVEKVANADLSITQDGRGYSAGFIIGQDNQIWGEPQDSEPGKNGIHKALYAALCRYLDEKGEAK